MPKPIKLANSCTFPVGNASSELLELDNYFMLYIIKRYHRYSEPCILCLVPCALCLVPCILHLSLVVVMAVVIDCQYCAMYMIPSTVLPKPNLILAHPLNTTSTVQSKEAIVRVDFCNMHTQLSCTVTR